MTPADDRLSCLSAKASNDRNPPITKTVRHRNKEHLRFVRTQPCLICAKQPSDPHHLPFAQPRALGRKVSDEYTVPLVARTIARRIGQPERSPGGKVSGSRHSPWLKRSGKRANRGRP